MKLVKTGSPTGCDNGACAERAEYLVQREDTALADSLFLCPSCVKELYSLFGGILAPKAAGNLIKKAQEKNAALAPEVKGEK
jgi:hypothetical protein